MNLPYNSWFSRALHGALLLASLCVSRLTADDWPVARGDTLGTAVAKTSLPDQLEVLWEYQAPNDAGFDATAVVADGTIYLGDTAGTFHAVRLADGTAVWTKTFPDSSFAAAAAVVNEYVYVGDLNGVVRALATADGEEKWSAKVDGEVYAGPTPHAENLLVTSESGMLTCLSLADGREVWPAFKIDAPLRCSPTISGGRAMLAGCDSLLHVIRAADGTELHTVQIDGPTGATPAMRDGRVFFGTESGTFFAIDVPKDNDQLPTVAWTFHDPKRGQPIRSAAAASADLVVFGAQGKAIYGLNPKSGEPKWTVPTRSRVESSPVITGRRVVAATTAGKLYLLDAATGETQWEFDAGGGFTASPAVVDGRILLGNTDGTLYCFGSKVNAAEDTTKNTKDTKITTDKQ
jgi:outer membrane protein assembly factor BamB